MFLSLNQIIKIPGWEVWNTNIESDRITFLLRYLNEIEVCHFCGSKQISVHKIRKVSVRDLEFLDKKTFLELERHQYYCNECRKYFTESSSDIDFQRGMTERYKNRIFEKIKNSTITHVAQEEGLTYDQVKGILESKFNGSNNLNCNINKISIDEFSHRKGQGNFATVICDLETANLIEVIDSHQQDKIIEILMEWPLEVREAITEVSVDMWGGFTKVIQTVFPNARIVYDRFHVMKILNEELNKIRKQCNSVLKDLKIKHIRSLILKNGTDLNDEEKKLLEIILKSSERLRNAYQLKEDFRQIYETDQEPEVAKVKLEEWLAKASKFYSQVITTIKNHFDGICNYFYNRTTSGKMEGINNKIKVIKRQAYGFTNFDHLRMRLLIACSH